jgi:ribosomal protein L16/L10AE
MVALFHPRVTHRTKLRRHKSFMRGQRLGFRLPTIAMGAIYANQAGYLNWRHLEAGRRFLTRQLRRARVRVRVRLNQPLTAKSRLARMGKGKGKFKGWVGFSRPGTLLYDLGPVSRKSWSLHPSPRVRREGLYPFERIRYKFHYGVRVLRRALSRPRSAFRAPLAYAAGRGPGVRLRRWPSADPPPPTTTLTATRPLRPLLVGLGRTAPFPSPAAPLQGLEQRRGVEELGTLQGGEPLPPALQQRLGRLLATLRRPQRPEPLLALLRHLWRPVAGPSHRQLHWLERRLRRLLRHLDHCRLRLRRADNEHRGGEFRGLFWNPHHPIRRLPSAEAQSLVVEHLAAGLAQRLGRHWYLVRKGPEHWLLLHWIPIVLRYRHRKAPLRRRTETPVQKAQREAWEADPYRPRTVQERWGQSSGEESEAPPPPKVRRRRFAPPPPRLPRYPLPTMPEEYPWPPVPVGFRLVLRQRWVYELRLPTLPEGWLRERLAQWERRRLRERRLVHLLNRDHFHPRGLAISLRWPAAGPYPRWYLGAARQRPLSLPWLHRFRHWLADLARVVSATAATHHDPIRGWGALDREWRRRRRTKARHHRYWSLRGLRRRRWWRYHHWRTPEVLHLRLRETPRSGRWARPPSGGGGPGSRRSLTTAPRRSLATARPSPPSAPSSSVKALGRPHRPHSPQPRPRLRTETLGLGLPSPCSASTHGAPHHHRAFRALQDCLLAITLAPAQRTSLGRRHLLWRRLPEGLARSVGAAGPGVGQRRLWATPLGERLPPEPLAPLAFGGRRWWPLRQLLTTERRLNHYLRHQLLQLFLWRQLVELRKRRRSGLPHRGLGRRTVSWGWYHRRRRRALRPFHQREAQVRAESQGWIRPDVVSWKTRQATYEGLRRVSRALRPRNRALFRNSFRSNRLLAQARRTRELPPGISPTVRLSRSRWLGLRMALRRHRTAATPDPSPWWRGAPGGLPQTPTPLPELPEALARTDWPSANDQDPEWPPEEWIRDKSHWKPYSVRRKEAVNFKAQMLLLEEQRRREKGPRQPRERRARIRSSRADSVWAEGGWASLGHNSEVLGRLRISQKMAPLHPQDAPEVRRRWGGAQRGLRPRGAGRSGPGPRGGGGSGPNRPAGPRRGPGSGGPGRPAGPGRPRGSGPRGGRRLGSGRPP